MLPFERLIIIDKNHKVPVYRQIAFSIINAIRNGILKPGTPLPGSRVLSKTLNVHRKTIISAYDELDAQDWITKFPRKHVLVSQCIPLIKPQEWNSSINLKSYEYDFDLPFRLIEKKIAKVGNPIIIIDDGHPDVRLTPIDELLKVYRSYTSRNYAIKKAQMGTEQGTLWLREEMIGYLSETRGLSISSDNILVTHGAQMSIYLASQLLLNETSNIIVGTPNYTLANRSFAEAGANLIEVAVDEHGINTDLIETICKSKKISAVYVIPHHHYPTTVTLSVERRMKLLELSNNYTFTIIEDDYDYDYHYTSSPYLPLASAGHNGNVIYIGSFSKILDPSLRIGYMVAPHNFIRQCSALRKVIDVGGDGYMQNALATLIKDGELKRHIRKAKKTYRRRRDFLDNLLKEKLSKYISYKLPSGGMAIWIKLDPKYSVGQLIKSSQLEILKTDLRNNAFRFGFASKNEQELEATVEILKSILQAQPFQKG